MNNFQQDLTPPAIIGEAVSGRAYELKKQLQVATKEIKTRTFDVAELLYTAKHENITFGYTSVAEYAAEELGIKLRKAQYLIRMVEVCKEAGVKREDYEPVGLSKLREITSLDPTATFWNRETRENEPLVDHIVRMITDCEELSLEEIAAEVKRLKGMDGDNVPVTRSTTYTKSVWENVIKPARELARKLLGSAKRDGEGNAVEYSDGAVEEVIHASFLADPNNQPEPVAVQTEAESPTQIQSVPMEEPQI